MMKKLYHMFRLALCRDGYVRAKYLKKHNVLGNIGDNCFWHPRRLPSEANAVYLHNNVEIGTGSIILPNIVLGPNVIVAAGSVVTKSFSGGDTGIIIGGNPAKVIHDWNRIKEKSKI